MTDRYAVFGNPIAHSKSPQIHAAFAAQTQQDLIYDRQLVAADQFIATAKNFFATVILRQRPQYHRAVQVRSI